MAERKSVLEQWGDNLGDAGNEILGILNMLRNQSIFRESTGKSRPDKTVPSIQGGLTARQEAAKAMSANLDDPVPILKEGLQKVIDRSTGRPEYVGSVGHRPTKEDLIAEQSGELASFYPPRQYAPATAQDNIYGEMPLKGPRGDYYRNAPGQSEFTNGPNLLPLSPGYTAGSDHYLRTQPGGFINGGEEIDAVYDKVAIAQLEKPTDDVATNIKNTVLATTAKALDFGTNTAKSQKQEGLINEASDTISGLLGNVDFKGLFRVLARPEFVAPMGPGQTPLTNFINAAAADRTAQAATRAAQQEAGLEGFKAETDRLKALMPDPSKMPKLTGEVSKLYDQLASSSRIGEIGSKIKAMVNDSAFATGGTGTAAQAARGIAAILGINVGSITADKLKTKIAVLKSEILKSKVFGREANKQELTMILDKMIADPSLTTSKAQILDTVDGMMRRAEETRYNAAGKLKYFGYRTEGFDKSAAPAFTRNN